MRRKNIIKKLFPHFIDISIVVILSFPLFIFLTRLEWVIVTAILFAAYHVFFLMCNDGRSMGMIILGDHYPEKNNLKKSLLHISLHTCIFGLLLFYVTTVL